MIVKIQSGDPVAGERAQDEAAETGVARRFQFQHRMRLDRVEGGEVVGELWRSDGVTAQAAVFQDGADRGVGGGHGQVVVVPPDDVASGPRPRIERVGVLDETWVGGRL